MSQLALSAALALAIGYGALKSPSGATTPAVDPCPGGQIIVMRAQDTTLTTVIGDTVYVQRTDTLLRVDDSTHQAFAIHIDSGAIVQLAAMCAPVTATYRLKVVPVLPSAAPPVVALALAPMITNPP